MLKLTPPSTNVAPSGELRPSSQAIAMLRHRLTLQVVPIRLSVSPVSRLEPPRLLDPRRYAGPGSRHAPRAPPRAEGRAPSHGPRRLAFASIASPALRAGRPASVPRRDR